MKQTTANKMGAVANLQTTLDDAGNFVAQIDPSKAETQLMRITEGAIAGAAVAIPPSALSIPISIMVGEGVALTTNSFSQDLGLTGNKIAAGGPSVSFTASEDVVASNPLTLSIPFGALAFALADVDTENLVVMYRWMSLKDGEPSYEVGVIPGDKVTRGQNKVSFQTTKFGTFQVGIAETKITKTLLATTEEPPALKSCERYAAAVYPTCTSDGQVGCVTTESLKAADLSLAKSEFILAGKTMASVTGSVTLPDPGKVLKDITYGAGGTEKTGNLTLPDPGKVMASSGTYGDPAAPRTPTLPDKGIWDLKTSFTGEGYYSGVSNIPTAAMIAGGTTVLGINVPPTPSLCADDGAASCVVDGTNFKAAKLSNFAPNDILSGKTIAGVQGNAPSRPENCSTDGELGCVVFGPNFAAAVVTGAASKILSGTSVAGIQGTAATRPSDCITDGESGCVASAPEFKAAKVTGSAQKILKNFSVAGIQGEAVLPPAGSVLSGMMYGNPDTQHQQTGTLILPAPASVLSGSGSYGDPAAPLIPSLTNRGTWDLTTSFPGEGYYNGTSNQPAATSIASGTTIVGVQGNLSGGGGYSLEAWNLRAGTTAGGVSGNLKTNCRNSGNPLIFSSQTPIQGVITSTAPLSISITSAFTLQLNEIILVKTLTGGDLPTTSFKVISISTSSIVIQPLGSTSIPTIFNNAYVGIYKNVIDPWDTVDDSWLSSVYQPIQPTGWLAEHQCGGVRDSNNTNGQWVDMSYAGGTWTACTAANCAFLDSATRLIWTRDSSLSAQTWTNAKGFCQTNTTLDSYPDSALYKWRLPTQKELMNAYVNGLNSVLAQTIFMPPSKTVWSGTTFVDSSRDNGSAWTMYLATGKINNSLKSSNNNILCVRDLGSTVVPNLGGVN
jgi:hypothetical protein